MATLKIYIWRELCIPERPQVLSGRKLGIRAIRPNFLTRNLQYETCFTLLFSNILSLKNKHFLILPSSLSRGWYPKFADMKHSMLRQNLNKKVRNQRNYIFKNLKNVIFKMCFFLILYLFFISCLNMLCSIVANFGHHPLHIHRHKNKNVFFKFYVAFSRAWENPVSPVNAIFCAIFWGVSLDF